MDVRGKRGRLKDDALQASEALIITFPLLPEPLKSNPIRRPPPYTPDRMTDDGSRRPPRPKEVYEGVKACDIQSNVSAKQNLVVVLQAKSLLEQAKTCFFNAGKGCPCPCPPQHVENVLNHMDRIAIGLRAVLKHSEVLGDELETRTADALHRIRGAIKEMMGRERRERKEAELDFEDLMRAVREGSPLSVPCDLVKDRLTNRGGRRAVAPQENSTCEVGEKDTGRNAEKVEEDEDRVCGASVSTLSGEAGMREAVRDIGGALGASTEQEGEQQLEVLCAASVEEAESRGANEGVLRGLQDGNTDKKAVEEHIPEASILGPGTKRKASGDREDEARHKRQAVKPKASLLGDSVHLNTVVTADPNGPDYDQLKRVGEPGTGHKKAQRKTSGPSGGGKEN
ncbi:hypothetical protein FA13DRAFT_199390 [Coprinellus micaceus]|uniref:Uncharacterized protein n=1 Tax=Coprinellus micaceus TaxID=71717 RepID=A0A4Y7THA7_COPMI|nr:hypothetical protein FA13DRAFT_199390 [Coprinellus micaceus]